MNEQKTEDLYAPHFKDGRYFNPWMPMVRSGFTRFLKWKLSKKEQYTDEEKNYLPKVVPGLKERIKALPSGNFIAWIGHSTFLIRLNNEYFITDPIFSDRAFLPKRKTLPAITPEEILDIAPYINVLVSHNHYDHLDEPSIKALSENTRVIVPMGLKGFIADMGKTYVKEMDWWQEFDTGKGIKIVCLPVQHWSRRLFQSINSSLWASYMIITPEVTIYYGADSGYFIGYREYCRLYPEIDYALMPTTATQPRWFMHYAHVDIDESIDAFLDLKAKYFVPTQWGTFHLGDEPVGYPALQLKRRIKERNLDPSRFLIMDIGEIIMLKRGR